jgi:hypothetical protein
VTPPPPYCRFGRAAGLVDDPYAARVIRFGPDSSAVAMPLCVLVSTGVLVGGTLAAVLPRRRR